MSNVISVEGFNSSGDPVSNGSYDLDQGSLTIKTLDKTKTWTLVLVDDTPSTNSYEHVGSRPSDRE